MAARAEPAGGEGGEGGGEGGEGGEGGAGGEDGHNAAGILGCGSSHSPGARAAEPKRKLRLQMRTCGMRPIEILRSMPHRGRGVVRERVVAALIPAKRRADQVGMQVR